MNDVLNQIHIIGMYEDKIINLKKYNAVMLGECLSKLKDLRKELYTSISDKNISNDIRLLLIKESNNFYLFNYKLLTSKTLSNAVFFEIFHKALADYSFVKPFDNDKYAYKFALRTIDYLKIDLKLSEAKMSNYRLRSVNDLTMNFIKKNKEVEKEINF